MTNKFGQRLAGKSVRSGEILASKLAAEGICNQSVLQAIARTPRHHFIPEILAHKAYENTALPIGQGQTISQPYIVAKMTELLIESGPVDKILEIGTGSGYQTAVLAGIVKHVFSVERIKSLQWQAKRRLQQLDLHNVSMKHGDGWQGWQSKGPFDAIIVTAAPTEVPTALLSQLNNGGRLIIPVGKESQTLQIIHRNGDEWDSANVEAVRFVPLVPGELL